VQAQLQQLLRLGCDITTNLKIQNGLVPAAQWASINGPTHCGYYMTYCTVDIAQLQGRAQKSRLVSPPVQHCTWWGIH
jgi:hypothetical protein